MSIVAARVSSSDKYRLPLPRLIAFVAVAVVSCAISPTAPSQDAAATELDYAGRSKTENTGLQSADLRNDQTASPLGNDGQLAVDERTDADVPITSPRQSPQVASADAIPRSLNGRMALGAVAASYSAAPEMIGDFFGGSFLQAANFDDNFGSGSGGGSSFASTVSIAGGDRRFKVAENVSPIPRDRVFFNFNHFENAVIDGNGQRRSLDRFTLGFEKTFLDGMASIETRLPFVKALDSKQFLAAGDNTGSEFGNVAVALKVELLSGPNWLITGGASATIPTGDDFERFDEFNIRRLLIENDAVHMAPFLGWLIQPNDRCFAQGFVQTDFDLGGNDVFSDSGFEGILQDQNLLFIDASFGQWILRSSNRQDWLTGIATIAELHYTTTINDTDNVLEITNPHNRMDILNGSAAIHMQFGDAAARIGGTVPLRDDEESLFDSEFIFQLNRNY